MNDEDKNNVTEAAGMGCLGIWLIIQIGIPIMLFLVLAMALLRGCARMFD